MKRSGLSAPRGAVAWILAGFLLFPAPLRAAVWKGRPSAPRSETPEARQRACERLREAGLPVSEAESRTAEMASEEVVHVAAAETGIRRGGDYTIALIVAAALVALYVYFSRPPPAFHNPGPDWID